MDVWIEPFAILVHGIVDCSPAPSCSDQPVVMVHLQYCVNGNKTVSSTSSLQQFDIILNFRCYSYRRVIVLLNVWLSCEAFDRSNHTT
jgi:hypothetical protein